jgi:hypothetical protein
LSLNLLHFHSRKISKFYREVYKSKTIQTYLSFSYTNPYTVTLKPNNATNNDILIP